MMAATRSFTVDGISARPLRVEADVHPGLPSFTVIGLPEVAVREMRERIRAALANCGYDFPLQRVVVTLAPAGLRKFGPALDLAVGAAVLAASGQLRLDALPRLGVIGELALDGSLRPVQGALLGAEAARAQGCEAIVVPAGNGPEAAIARDIDVIPIDSLARLAGLASGEWRPERPKPICLAAHHGDAPDLADLRGNENLRGALEVSAAGGHSLLMIGPPGSGRSLAAVRLPSILPPLEGEEALEVARVASAAGRLSEGSVRARPFRAPHHSISPTGLLGANDPRRIGEATLADRGVLFLEELAEFRRDALEGLRVPLRAGRISLSDRGAWRTLPARFLFVAAAKPCPCGRGEGDPACACAPLARREYRSRLAAALPDDIDIEVEMRIPSAAEIGGPPGESSASVRERVTAARERQEKRLGAGRCNALMTPDEVDDCALEGDAAALLGFLRDRGRVGRRTQKRAVRLARTLADLDGAEAIEPKQMALALSLCRRRNPA